MRWWLAVAVLTAGCGAGESGPPRPSPEGAMVFCEERVLDGLLSPSLAAFQPRDEQIPAAMDSVTYSVFGWVDAANAFGTPIRRNYLCELQWVEPHGWNLTNLYMY